MKRGKKRIDLDIEDSRGSRIDLRSWMKPVDIYLSMWPTRLMEVVDLLIPAELGIRCRAVAGTVVWLNLGGFARQLTKSDLRRKGCRPQDEVRAYNWATLPHCLPSTHLGGGETRPGIGRAAVEKTKSLLSATGR